MGIALAIVEFTTQLSFIMVLWTVSRAIVQNHSYFQWVIHVGSAYPMLFMCAGLHIMTAPMVLGLSIGQLRLISKNVTMNEMLNMHRYKHFWSTSAGTKSYQNPFHKGGVLANCLDF